MILSRSPNHYGLHTMLDSRSTFSFVIKEAQIIQSSTGVCINPDLFMFSVKSRGGWICDNNQGKFNL